MMCEMTSDPMAGVYRHTGHDHVNGHMNNNALHLNVDPNSMLHNDEMMTRYQVDEAPWHDQASWNQSDKNVIKCGPFYNPSSPLWQASIAQQQQQQQCQFNGDRDGDEDTKLFHLHQREISESEFDDINYQQSCICDKSSPLLCQTFCISDNHIVNSQLANYRHQSYTLSSQGTSDIVCLSSVQKKETLQANLIIDLEQYTCPQDPSTINDAQREEEIVIVPANLQCLSPTQISPSNCQINDPSIQYQHISASFEASNTMTSRYPHELAQNFPKQTNQDDTIVTKMPDCTVKFQQIILETQAMNSHELGVTQQSTEIKSEYQYEDYEKITKTRRRTISHRQSARDALKNKQIPLTYEEIVNTTIDVYTRLLENNPELTDDQLRFIKDTRRRGKNKLAAQNCREKKRLMKLYDSSTKLVS